MAPTSDHPRKLTPEEQIRKLERIQLPAAEPELAIPDVLREPPSSKASKSITTHEPGVVANLAGAGKAWAIAAEFMFTIIAGGGIGYAIDRWQASSPTGVLLGLAIGFVVAFVRIIQTTRRQERLEAEQRRRSGKA